MKAFCQIYAQWDQVDEEIEQDARHLLGLGLTCDTTFSLEQGRSQGGILREILASGGLCAPNIYPATYDPACRDSNWWKYSPEECAHLLRIAQEQYSALDLGPMVAVSTYTPGNSFVTACRQVGVHYVLGFCAPIVIEDGGWEIAHYGSPLSPYFVGEEDYRKPENPGGRPDSVLMSSMELRNPLVCMNHWSEGPWCPLNAQAADRWLEPSAEPLPFLAIAEDWLRQAELSGEPSFFHLNLQYFFAGRCREHNRRALEWLADQRDKGRLEVGGLKQWSELLRANGGFQRQTTYWRGEMMGFHVGHRPGCYPDVVVDESLSHQGVWEKPDPLPKRFYDYGPKWNYPAFEPKGDAPMTADFSEVEVNAYNDGGTWTVRVLNSDATRRMPLLLWDCLEGWEGPFSIDGLGEGWCARVVPHPAGVSGVLLLDGEVPTGETKLRLQVTGFRESKQRFARSWPDLVEAQTFFHRGRPYTVLAAQTPEPFAVRVRLSRSSPEPIVYESLCGIEYQKLELVQNESVLNFDGSRLVCWHRFWGVTVDQIELSEMEATKAELRARTARVLYGLSSEIAPDAPGYQTFGNIRNPARWDRKISRVAGELEMQRCNEWLRAQVPADSEVVVEVHPGIYLPRGSITKVLGHEFDHASCAPGYGFQELCVDYPQGWDWGVSAWVQWRSLRVQINGLSAASHYRLHLHAFDPEGRDIVQRVHFFDPDLGDESLEVCAVREWVLPVGLEGRWENGALCSVRIPEVCLQWPSLGVWIVPLERSKLYDWVRERGAPGMFSHLWVTKTV